MKVSSIGIFWVLGENNLLVHTIEWNRAAEIIGNWCNYGGHYEFWENNLRKYSIDHDYTDFPRGRVLYNKKTKVSKILSSRKVIGDRALVKQIAKTFHLKKYLLRSDAHYEDPI